MQIAPTLPYDCLCFFDTNSRPLPQTNHCALLTSLPSASRPSRIAANSARADMSNQCHPPVQITGTLPYTMSARCHPPTQIAASSRTNDPAHRLNTRTRGASHGRAHPHCSVSRWLAGWLAVPCLGESTRTPRRSACVRTLVQTLSPSLEALAEARAKRLPVTASSTALSGQTVQLSSV